LGRTTASTNQAKRCTSCREEFCEENHRGRAYRPQVNLIMATTPTGLEESVTLAALDKGLLGRFLVARAYEEAPLKTNVVNTRLDKDTINYITQLKNRSIGANELYQYNGVKYPVEEVKCIDEQEYSLYFDKIQEMQKRLDPMLAPIIARMPQQMNKLALIHAAGRIKGDTLVIDKVDLEFAYKMCLYNVKTFQDIVDNYLFRTALEKEYKIVLRSLKKHDNLLLVDDLVFDLRPYLKRKRIMEILEELVNANETEMVQSEDHRLGVRLI
jgi:hypothetical protein